MNLKDKVSQWVTSHKDEIIQGCYVAICVGAAVAPIISKSRKVYLERRRDRMIYDPSMGFYWELKRTLTSNQKLMIEQRHRQGESYGKILKDLNLLRR